jgi:hypothetical protein
MEQEPISPHIASYRPISPHIASYRLSHHITSYHRFTHISASDFSTNFHIFTYSKALGGLYLSSRTGVQEFSSIMPSV